MASEEPNRNSLDRHAIGNEQYLRSYAACDRCRRRKVKCIIQQKPPCAKCKREHRDCVFSRQRRHTKQREPPDWTTSGNYREQSWSRYNVSEHEGQSPEVSFGSTMPSNTMPTAHEPATTNRDLSARSRSSLVERVLPSAILSTDNSIGFERPVQDGFQTESFPADTTPTQSSCDSASMVNQLLDCTDEQRQIWSNCRFVRQGWLSPQAAATYVELFRRHIAPFTPVRAGEYCKPDNQRRLVNREPMLCCVILMISTKFFTIAGAGGILRGQMLHQRLWEHCESLIRRILYGLEEASTARVRIVSTIESFLLLSDWQPQSILFPLDDDPLDSDLESSDPQAAREADYGQGPAAQWRNHFLKPARRSDRMSLMMLGVASNLAYELGLFADDLGMTTDDNEERGRRMRTRKLLYIYVINIAIKMGFPSGLPQDIVFAASKESFNALSEAGTHFEAWNTIADSWLELVRLSKAATAIFFVSNTHTKQQLLNGQYVTLIQHFTPLLNKWHADLQSSHAMGFDPLRTLLLIEYHTLRASISALSMQAVVERASARSITPHTPTDLRSTCFLSQDVVFIHEVIASSRAILHSAISMALNGTLRLVPVRQTLSIISATILLFKAISLGISELDLRGAMETLERCVRVCKPREGSGSGDGSDELDFSARFAGLIDARMSAFKNTFTRVRDGDGGVLRIRTVQGDPMEGVPGVVTTPQTPGAGSGTSGSGGNGNGSGNGIEANAMLDSVLANVNFGDVVDGDAGDLWTRPFDPGLAPFSAFGDHISSGLEMDSLDFLWNTEAGF